MEQQVTQWTMEATQNRKKAIDLLNNIKAARKGRQFKIVQVDDKTWIEKEIK